MADSCSETELETESESASDNDFEMIESHSCASRPSASNREQKAKRDSNHEHIDRSISIMKNLTKKKTDLWCLALQLTLKKLPPMARKEMKAAITNLIDNRYSSARKSQHSAVIELDPVTPETEPSDAIETKNAQPNNGNEETAKTAVAKLIVAECPAQMTTGGETWQIVWSGPITMTAVTKFTISLSSIYGDASHLVFPLELDVIGRIVPETVYKYIATVKLTNEIALLRFSPVSKDDESAYQAFFKYLHSRHRFGVIHTRCKLIKDFYILPLTAGQKLPSILLPADGNVDLGAVRTDLLLGIIVKSFVSSIKMTKYGK